MIELKNIIKDYAWGDKSSISDFLKIENSMQHSQAEMWIGTHKDGMSVIKESGKPLSSIAELNFMAKLLAAETPLSIQVHPNLEEARMGYSFCGNEQPQDITYKDYNHKPEMIIAFSETFSALAGFKNPQEVKAIIDLLCSGLKYNSEISLLNTLAYNNTAKLKEVVKKVLLDNKYSQDLLLIIRKSLSSLIMKNDEILNLKFILSNYKNDPGLIIATLMKFYKIKKGEAIYIPPKTIHAYMRGFGLEVMASSDNVIRCGLTNKFIDKSEMLKILSYDFDIDHIVVPFYQDGITYWSPSDSFKVALTNKEKEFVVQANSIILAGSEHCRISEEEIERGSSYFVENETKMTLSEGIYIIN